MVSIYRRSSILIALFTVTICHAQAAPVTASADFFSPEGRVVTQASYPTDETSRQILQTQSVVGMNRFQHNRKLTPTDDQPVVRMNRDTYYSRVVIDVSEGATITLPDVPEGKYMSFQPVTEDHRIQPMSYGPGTYELATHIGSHVYVIVRLDATFSEEEAARYQNQMSINAASDKMFSTESIEPESFKRVENELKAKMPMLARLSM